MQPGALHLGPAQATQTVFLVSLLSISNLRGKSPRRIVTTGRPVCERQDGSLARMPRTGLTSPRVRSSALLAAVLLACAPSLAARGELRLDPPDLTQVAGAGAPAFTGRLEVGLSTGELVGDFVLRSAFLGMSLAILCISSCASAVSPWQGTLGLLLLHPLLDTAWVWGAGKSSDSFQPRFLYTLLGSYGGAAVEGLLLLLGVVSGDWGVTVALGLLGSALAAVGTVYVQVVTKVALADTPSAAGPARLVTVAAF